MCKKLIKNSQHLGKIFQKTALVFLTHTVGLTYLLVLFGLQFSDVALFVDP